MATPTATFTMTQLAAANRIYQRSTFTGGDAGKGAGAIPVTISAASAGTFNLRLSSGGATRGDVKAAWAGGTVAAGATTLSATDIPAREGWFYLDIETTAGWQNGTVPVGMGALVAMAGQSLAVDMVAKLHDTGTSIASTGAAINPNGRALFSWTNGTPYAAANWTEVTDAANSTGVVNSAGAAELLDLLVRKLGINVGLIGNAVGATSITRWLPGQAAHTELARVITLAGGAFETFIWFQGHSDAATGMAYHTYKGHLSTLFTDLAGRSSVPFAKYLSAIPNINSASWGNFGQRAVIRRAQRDWCIDNNGFYVPFSDVSLSADAVHLRQTGSRQASQHFARAMTAGDAGPVLISVVKSGVELLCTVQHGSGGTGLVAVGSPATRMLVMNTNNSAGTALTLDAVAPLTVTGADTFTIKLASDPGDVPLEVWPMAVHPVADGSASGLWDNSDDGDGIARGRQLRFGSVPVLRKRTGVLSTAGVSFGAGKFGQGRSGGEMISGGPLLTDIPYAGRTLEAWASVNTLPSAARVIASSSGVMGMWLTASGQMTVAWSNTGSTSFAHGLTADGLFHHFRWVIEPGNALRRLYIDGVLKHTSTSAIGTRNLVNPFAIGGHGGAPGTYTYNVGTIDEVAIFDRALSAAECAIVPTAPYTGLEANLMYLWQAETSGADSASTAALTIDYAPVFGRSESRGDAAFGGADAAGAATTDTVLNSSSAAVINIVGSAQVECAGVFSTQSSAVVVGSAIIAGELSAAGSSGMLGDAAATAATSFNGGAAGSLAGFSGGIVLVDMLEAVTGSAVIAGDAVIDSSMVDGGTATAVFNTAVVMGAAAGSAASGTLAGVGATVRSGDVAVTISSTLAVESAVTVGGALAAAGSGGGVFTTQVYQSTALIVSGQGSMVASSVEAITSDAGDRVVRIGPQSRIIYIGATT